MRRRILALPVAIALVAIPGAVAAQACVGVPVAESYNAVTAQVGFPQDGMAYGAGFRHNMTGPFSFGASYSLSAYDNVDPKQHGLGAEVNYELTAFELPLSVCPTVGLGYSRIADDVSSISALSVPVGVGFGKAFPLSQKVSVVPHVVPQWVWTRATVEFGAESISADDSVLAALFGATFSLPRFYVGGGVTWINEDGVDPIFAIMGGMPF
ncbi:MAG TPA: hypothetical protein VMM12_05415 [Longimicrobiales bacterium]|nr:hypothetical protein [Longimicrobiales bacterium]